MARRAAHSSDEDKLSLDDVCTFVDAYDCVESKNLANFVQLCKAMGDIPVTTATNQLERIAGFAPQAGDRVRSPSKIAQLFRVPTEGDGFLRPTKEAQELYQYLKTLRDLYLVLRDRVRERSGRSRPTVRIGMTQNFGQYLFSFALSAWKEKFGRDLDLQVELGPSETLIPRVHAGLLDALLAYGSEDGAGVPQGAPEVAFSSFGMGSRMVLVAPAPAEVLLLSGKDVNRNYWKDFFAPLLADKLEEYRQDRGRRKPATAKQARPVGEARELKRPFYEDLLHIDPAEIDFDRTRLIWVPSWAQPDGLVSLHARLRENQNLLHVASYDEALAMTRMNFGVAILPQIYSKRKGVTTFRLPEDRFTRWIGAYYSTRFKLTRETYHLLTFVRKYVQEFMAPIRDGEPAAFHHAWFQEFCERLTFEDDWCAGAARDYPLKPARTGSGGEGEATS